MPANLPPGPRLPAPVQTFLLGRYWDRWLRACERRYGPVFTINAPPFGPAVYFTDPAAIKEIFTGEPATMHAGEAHEMLAPVLGERSVLVSDEAEHLRLRKLMLPLFHGEAVRAYADLVEELVEDELDTWPLHGALELHPRMRALTFEVILRAVFGVTEPGRKAYGSG